MIVRLKNNVGVVKEAPIGFSWTMLFFGPLVPLFRGDLKWTALFLLAVFLTLPCYGIGWLILPFIYNKRYVISLFERGYEPADEEARNVLVSKGIISATRTEKEQLDSKKENPKTPDEVYDEVKRILANAGITAETENKEKR